MENEVLKTVFQEMHSQIVRSVTPDSVMDTLFSEKVISFDDFERLRLVPGNSDRCRGLLSLLRKSSHPQTFITLRLALIDEYKWIVDEIDKKLRSPTSQLHQLHLPDTSMGKLQLRAHKSM